MENKDKKQEFVNEMAQELTDEQLEEVAAGVGAQRSFEEDIKKYKELLSSQGYSKEEIDRAVDKWVKEFTQGNITMCT